MIVQLHSESHFVAFNTLSARALYFGLSEMSNRHLTHVDAGVAAASRGRELPEQHKVIAAVGL